MENIKKVAMAVIEGLNVASAVIHKQGLGVVFNLSDEVLALSSMQPGALKAELPELLDPAKRADLVAACQAKLALQNPVVQDKLKASLVLASDAVDVGLKAHDLLVKVKALVA